MTDADSERTERIALGVEQKRNRQLLSELFTEADVTVLTKDVPNDTDLCIVDSGGVQQFGGALKEWRTAQEPRFAPVLLLVSEATDNPWQRFADGPVRSPDAVVEIPTRKAEIAARVDTLLEMRAMSHRLESEMQLTRQVFETSPVAKLVLDTDGTVTRANDRAAEMFRPHSDPVGQPYDAGDWTAVDEDGTPIQPTDLPFETVVATGESVYGQEFGIDTTEGERRWLSVSAAPIRGADGEPEYVVVSMEDRTVRRNQERELERQVDLFTRAQDIANVGAWEYDVRTGEAYWTEQVAAIHGLDGDTKASVERSLEYYHPDDRETVETAFDRAIEAGEAYDLELRLRDATGKLRWVRTRGEPQLEDGDVVRVRGTIQDITDRKERELELERMRNAVEDAPIGVTISDPALDDNPLVYVNAGFVEQTGYSRTEAVGRNCRFLQGEDTDRQTVAKIRRAIDREEPVSVDIRNYRADGAAFWNRLSVAPVRDSDGEVINYVGFQQDISDRVEQQRQLNLLDRYLRHNLRNGMNIIAGTAERIHDQGDESTAAGAETIERQAEAVMASVEKERTITKLLQESTTREPVDIIEVVEGAVADVRDESRVASIAVSGPDRCVVTAVPQLTEAVEELVRNAVEHNDAPVPEVAVAVTDREEEVVITVADNGPGLPEMERERLVDDIEETPLRHGQGIGLRLVQLIVRQSNGRIDCTGEESAGTEIVIRLPATSGPTSDEDSV